MSVLPRIGKLLLFCFLSFICYAVPLVDEVLPEQNDEEERQDMGDHILHDLEKREGLIIIERFLHDGEDSTCRQRNYTAPVYGYFPVELEIRNLRETPRNLEITHMGYFHIGKEIPEHPYDNYAVDTCRTINIPGKSTSKCLIYCQNETGAVNLNRRDKEEFPTIFDGQEMGLEGNYVGLKIADSDTGKDFFYSSYNRTRYSFVNKGCARAAGEYISVAGTEQFDYFHDDEYQSGRTGIHFTRLSLNSFPADDRMLTFFRIILLSDTEFQALNKDQKQVLLRWVALGGTLFLNNHKRQDYGWGRVENLDYDNTKINMSNKPRLLEFYKEEVLPLLNEYTYVSDFDSKQLRQEFDLLAKRTKQGGEGKRIAYITLVHDQDYAQIVQSQISRTGKLKQTVFPYSANTLMDCYQYYPYQTFKGAEEFFYEVFYEEKENVWGIPRGAAVKNDKEVVGFFKDNAVMLQHFVRVFPFKGKVSYVGETSDEEPQVQSTLPCSLKEFRYTDGLGRKWGVAELPPNRKVTLKLLGEVSASWKRPSRLISEGYFEAKSSSCDEVMIKTLSEIDWKDEISFRGEVIDSDKFATRSH